MLGVAFQTTTNERAGLVPSNDSPAGARGNGTATTIETMGFETELFVQQPIDRNLICNVCHSVLEKPTACCRNSHLFCRECIETWATRSTECPTCRDEIISSKMMILPLQNLILGLQVRCPGKEEKQEETNKAPRVEGAKDVSEFKAGAKFECCEWQGTLSDYIEKHQNKECLFGSVKCPLGCNEIVSVRELEKHKSSDCTHRTVSCNLCKREMEQHILQDHERNECCEAKTACEYCGMRMLRKFLGCKPTDCSTDDTPGGPSYLRMFYGHYRVCHKMPVKCDFYDCGCTTTIKRMDLEQHHAEYGRRHAQLVATSIASLKKATEWNEQEIVWHIPVSVLREARYSYVSYFIQESNCVSVGLYKAFLRLTVLEEGGPARVCVLVDNPNSVPIIADLVIGAEPGEVNKCAEQRMKKENDGGNTWLAGGILTFDDDNGDTQNATLEDLIRDCDSSNKVTIHAYFRLKSPESVTVTTRAS